MAAQAVDLERKTDIALEKKGSQENMEAGRKAERKAIPDGDSCY